MTVGIRHKSKSRGMLIGYLICIFAFFAVATFAVWHFFILDDDPVPRVEKILAKAGPPVGATREEVEAWLKQHNIPNERVDGLEHTGGYPAQHSPSEFGGVAPGATGGYLLGKIDAPHNSGRGWAREVFLYFFFDKHGRLIQHMVKAWDGYF